MELHIARFQKAEKHKRVKFRIELTLVLSDEELKGIEYYQLGTGPSQDWAIPSEYAGVGLRRLRPPGAHFESEDPSLLLRCESQAREYCAELRAALELRSGFGGYERVSY